MDARGRGRAHNNNNNRGRGGRGGTGGGYIGGRTGGFDGGRGGGRGAGYDAGGRGGGYNGGGRVAGYDAGARGGGRGAGYDAGGRGGGYNGGGRGGGYNGGGRGGGYNGGGRGGGYDAGGRGGGYNGGGRGRGYNGGGRGGGYNQPAQQYGPNGGEGSSSGQPKSRSDNYADKLRQLSNHSTKDGGLVSKIQSLNLSGKAPQMSNTDEKVPVKRPDKGGVAKIRTVNILVNHFPVQFDPKTVIRHYDIDIKPEVAPTRGRPVKMSKANLNSVMEKLLSDNPDFPVEMTAFDGEKNIFSAVPLPTGTFTVTLPPQEDGRGQTYKFSVTPVNELKLHKLKDYFTGNLLQLPREVLQGMDVVMKENPKRHLISIGKSFHPIDPTDLPLRRGLVASEGFQHSLKPTSQGLALCLDYSVLAVRKRISVLQFLKEHIGLTVVNSNNFRSPSMRSKIEGALKGLKVTVIHRRTKQKYVISGLTDKNACDICFTAEDSDGQLPQSSVRLLDYFQEKYPGVIIEHGDIPCLSLGKGQRANYVPIELCVLVEGQRVPKDSLDRDIAMLLKDMSLASPSDRRLKICGMLQHDHGPAGGEISRNFGIDVAMQMTKVKGRVIEPPKLKLRSARNEVIVVNVDKESCQWNLVNKQVIEGTSLVHWAVLDLSYYDRAYRLNNDFIPMLVARCEKLGMHMELPLFTQPAYMHALHSAESISRLLESVRDQALKDYQVNLQLILCVMTRKDPGYKFIKWVSETKIGIVTQCCLSKMPSKGQDQYLAQLGMKINGKLGGSNVELLNQSLFREEDHVMLIGADVNHPRPLDFGSPSIAAVVASMNWPAGNKYIPRVCPQDHRVEEIKGFGLICLELIECYEELNGVKPQKLVIFRDGVSEGQFDMVLNRELLDLDSVLENIADYNPTITLIVAQKRHQTRLFPNSKEDEGNKGNVPPGTVVDTTIVHPWEFDFYLCSHNGSIGTSKPTHYHILWDEHGFSSDQWQKFIYDLCFIYARCCKPVSLVPPVYYADLLAYRRRLHYDAQSEAQSSSANSSSGNSSSSSATSSSTFATLIENAMHVDVINSMYFI